MLGYALGRSDRTVEALAHFERAVDLAPAGMRVAIGDIDRSGTMDIIKTNFAGDTSTLYLNTHRPRCAPSAPRGSRSRCARGVRLSRPRGAPPTDQRPSALPVNSLSIGQ